MKFTYNPVSYIHQVVLLQLLQKEFFFEDDWLIHALTTDADKECELQEKSIRGAASVLRFVSPPDAELVFRTASRIFLGVFPNISNHIKAFGTAEEKAAHSALDQSCSLLSSIADNERLPHSVRFVTLMPCLFSMKACYSYAHHYPLRMFFQNNYDSEAFKIFYDKVQGYKKLHLKTALDAKTVDRMYLMGVKANEDWINEINS